jgi:uncharacterized protein with FMN-binding domain
MIPRRAAAAIAVTVLGLVLLFSFKTPAEPAVTASGTEGAVAVGQSSAGPTALADSGATATASPTATSDPTAAAAAPSAPAPATPSTAASDGRYSGQVVNTRYGPVQVQVTISNGKIVDVTAIQLPSTDPRSAQISQYVEPILRSSALQAQSAQVDLVSGATYTSEAYAGSLQAALDQAGL